MCNNSLIQQQFCKSHVNGGLAGKRVFCHSSILRTLYIYFRRPSFNPQGNLRAFFLSRNCFIDPESRETHTACNMGCRARRLLVAFITFFSETSSFLLSVCSMNIWLKVDENIAACLFFSHFKPFLYGLLWKKQVLDVFPKRASFKFQKMATEIVFSPEMSNAVAIAVKKFEIAVTKKSKLFSFCVKHTPQWIRCLGCQTFLSLLRRDCLFFLLLSSFSQ